MFFDGEDGTAGLPTKTTLENPRTTMQETTMQETIMQELNIGRHGFMVPGKHPQVMPKKPRSIYCQEDL